MSKTLLRVFLQVIGIWFYDDEESAMVTSLLQGITASYAGQPAPLDHSPALVSMLVNLAPATRTTTVHVALHSSRLLLTAASTLLCMPSK